MNLTPVFLKTSSTPLLLLLTHNKPTVSVCRAVRTPQSGAAMTAKQTYTDAWMGVAEQSDWITGCGVELFWGEAVRSGGAQLFCVCLRSYAAFHPVWINRRTEFEVTQRCVEICEKLAAACCCTARHGTTRSLMCGFFFFNSLMRGEKVVDMFS